MDSGWNLGGRARSGPTLCLLMAALMYCGPAFGQGGGSNPAAPAPAPPLNDWPTDPAVTRAPYLASPYTDAGGDAGIASVVNGPMYSPGSEEEQLSRRLAPPMIGDNFFGNLTGLGSVLPGELTGQAIFFPTANVNDVDYFRRVDPAGPGTFITNNLVLVPSGDIPPGTRLNPLVEFDDNGVFVGDPADLGAASGNGLFLAVPDGIGGTVNLQAPEVGGPLVNQPLFNIHNLAIANVPLPGQVVGLTKISQNNSPLPRNRVYMDFSNINDVPLTADGINVRRFAPGAEWTFWNGQASWEIRVPMAVTLDTEITADGGFADTSKGELGDVAVTLKQLLYRDDVWAYSIGLMVTAPTASDVQVKLADETELLEVSNQTVRIMPFWGALYTPSDRFFAQMFLQGDFDASGSPVKVNDFRGGFNNIGNLHDTAFFFGDVSFGFWVYRNLPTITRTYSEGVQHVTMHEYGPLHLSGVAPMLEVHYSRSLDQTDTLSSSGFQIGRTQDSIETWNLALGGTLEFGPKVTATAAYLRPLGGGSDKQFAGEVRVFLNIWLGAPQ